MEQTKKNDPSRNIPVEIKRKVLIEAGHCCAIPTCQFNATEFSHIEPFSKIKKHRADNIIALCPNHHDAFDNKKTIDKKSIKIYKLKLQFLNSKYTKYELRLLSILSKKSAVIAAGEIQVLGLLEDGLIKNEDSFMWKNILWTDVKNGNIFEDSAILFFKATLTEKGKEFIKTWESKDKEFDALS